MAKLRICSIVGCDKKHYSRGWCEGHYTRWRRHGDPLDGNPSRGEPLIWLTQMVASDPADGECIIWPYARRDAGYGIVMFQGRGTGAHRAACILAHGAPTAERPLAAHSCGKGHLGCVHPKHVRWASSLENSQDAVYHRLVGIAPPFPTKKLSEAQVEYIRSRHGKDKIAVLAKQFGVSESLIFRIHTGERRATAKMRLAS